MKHLFKFILLFSSLGTFGQNINTQPNTQEVLLPNGWALTPAGRSLEVGDLPLNIAVSSSQKLMAVTNNGQGKTNNSID